MSNMIEPSKTDSDNMRLLSLTIYTINNYKCDHVIAVCSRLKESDLDDPPYKSNIKKNSSRKNPNHYSKAQILKKTRIYILKEYKILYKLMCSTTHPAFHTESNLEKLALKYGHKVVFSSKFHLELNPIEGLWCYLKQHIRARTNQTFPRMMEVLAEAKEKLSKKMF
ncbi:hypothetical protein BpHYR1_050402 [Brachionus plicatilis]|uniref:Tc1-like transposase DDE domain-containing protein n=1 Tax=Brachionus plicatilis TaxID=10195 RepID=A0A3M7SBW3_BRAPC|nr:hypothetical protein BpHYR1_050402 [Brachionus plicatilis]